MGLDMYVYKISKIKPEEAENIRGKFLYDASRDVTIFDGYGPELEHIKGFLTAVPMKKLVLNIERLKAKNGIPEEGYIYMRRCGNGEDSATFFIGVGQEMVVADIHDDDYDEVEIEGLACKLESVAYWRKHYKLQDAIYEAAPYAEILNCGYYPLDAEMVKAIIKYDEERQLTFYEDSPEMWGQLLYHEWY